ncbi:MAG: hypothetical protein K9H64_15025 [Bacteroidales bacterium]|nr:hypothetical protein [Bacteroidales bacterium]MCF8457316.1 hypothetical protein [Bacteroidales bacterium]
MKKNILLIAFGLVLSLGFVSCEQCIKCEIIGNIPDTSFMVNDTNLFLKAGVSGFLDTNNKFYPEFCGSKSEREAFESDVRFNAESRECRIYAFRKIPSLDTIATMIYCGGPIQFKEFEYGLDTLKTTTYSELDVEWVVDTTLLNPATWSCK